MEYQRFLNIFSEILSKHAPMKQKYLRVHQGRFITKKLPYTRQLWNILDLEIRFWAIDQRCLENNTKNNETLA